MNSRVILPQKTPLENLPIEFPFQSLMQFGEGISNFVLTCTVWSGVDPNPDLMVSLAGTVNETTVLQEITGGLAGVTYLITCVINSTNNNLYTRTAYLSVINPDASFS